MTDDLRALAEMWSDVDDDAADPSHRRLGQLARGLLAALDEKAKLEKTTLRRTLDWKQERMKVAAQGKDIRKWMGDYHCMMDERDHHERMVEQSIETISGLETERDRLREEVASWKKEAIYRGERLEDYTVKSMNLRARAEELEGALRIHGNHRTSCSHLRGSDECDCGWAELRSALDGKGEAERE